MIFYTNQGDTPIFCTNTDELGFVREGVVGERKNPKMKEIMTGSDQGEFFGTVDGRYVFFVVYIK